MQNFKLLRVEVRVSSLCFLKCFIGRSFLHPQAEGGEMPEKRKATTSFLSNPVPCKKLGHFTQDWWTSILIGCHPLCFCSTLEGADQNLSAGLKSHFCVSSCSWSVRIWCVSDANIITSFYVCFLFKYKKKVYFSSQKDLCVLQRERQTRLSVCRPDPGVPAEMRGISQCSRSHSQTAAWSS